MSTGDNSSNLIQVTADSLDEAVEVLALAFENDPFINYLLSHDEKNYFDKVREIFRFVCEARLELGLPLLGGVNHSRPVGVACVSVPEKKDWPIPLIEKNEKLKAFIGSEASGIMKKFSNLSKQYAPEKPHHYLAAIGVHPEFQRNGFGRLLLDEVHEIAESHTESVGVYLETTNQVNVDLYEYFGYHLVARDTLDGIVELWYMFRPNKDNDKELYQSILDGH